MNKLSPLLQALVTSETLQLIPSLKPELQVKIDAVAKSCNKNTSEYITDLIQREIRYYVGFLVRRDISIYYPDLENQEITE